MKTNVNVYLSYAHRDERYREELARHLSLLKRQGVIASWHDQNISAGAEWEREIDTYLNTADIILLLVTPDFIASDYCYSFEMRRALERHETRQARVIPIILRPTDWHFAPFGKLQALPTGGKPVTTWPDRDEAFLDIAQGIRKAVQKLLPSPSTAPQFRDRTPEQVVASLPIVINKAVKRDDMAALKRGLEQYCKEHPYDRLMLSNKEILYFENFVQVAYAWQRWQTLTSLVSSGNRILPIALMEEIVQLLTSSLLNSATTQISLHNDNPFFWSPLDVQQLFENTHLRLPRQIPVFLYTRPHFHKSDASELFSLVKEIAPTSRLALVLFFLTPEQIEDASKILKNTLQYVYAYDIIPLAYEDFLRIIDARDPRKAFRQYILSKVDLTVISPFITTGPTPDSMFFGREPELHAISKRADSASYALIGGRRIGKTSILRRLARFSLPEAGFNAFYQDCSYTPTQVALVKAVVSNKTWFPNAPPAQFTSFADVIQSLPGEKPLVILLDEVDKLIPPDQPIGYPLFNTLRALANAGRCQFVFGGEYSLRSDMMDPKSPLYNFANEVLIGRLGFHAIWELIIQPMKELEIELVGEEAIVQRIWSFTSGHPNVVQRLCQRLITKLNREQPFRLSIGDVEEVIKDPDFLRKDFLDTYWEQATTLERLCSLIMARDDTVRTLSAAHKALAHLDLHPLLNQVNDALERLVDLRNILQRTADGYEFAVAAFPEVISKTSKLDDLIALTCEKYKLDSKGATHPKRGAQ